MIRFVISLPLLPQRPGDGQPAVGQAAISVTIRAAAGPDSFPVADRPQRSGQRGLGPLLSDVSQGVVTRLAEVDHLALAAAVGDWAGATYE